MSAKKRERIAELQFSLLDLAGDLIALSSYLEGRKKYTAVYGSAAAAIYLFRTRDYINQHLEEIKNLTDFIVDEENSKFYWHIAKNRRG